jgi:hypothetical protein
MKLDAKVFLTIAFIILIALLAGILSAYQYYESAKKEKSNDELSQKLEKAQEETLLKANELNDALKKNNELQERIFNMNKAIKFPMPESIEISYFVSFKFEDELQEKAVSILNNYYKNHSESSGNNFPVNEDLIEDIVEWKKEGSDWLTVCFSKVFTISKTTTSLNSIIGFTNFQSIHTTGFQVNEKVLFYFPKEKQFWIKIEHVQLQRINVPSTEISTTLINTSIEDLSNSSIIFSQSFPSSFKSIKILNFNISSKELNLFFPQLTNTENEAFFTNKVKKIEK